MDDWTNVTANQELLLQRMPIIASLWAHVGMDVMDVRTRPVRARELIFSCATPPIQPYLWQLGQERFLRVPPPPPQRPR